MNARLQSAWTVARRKVLTAGTIVANCSNWIPVLGSRLVRGSYKGAVRLRSGVTIHPRHDLAQGWGEIFEPAIADVYGLRLSPPPDVIWDIGANIGAFCCVAAHAFPDAAIIAYEPDSEVVEVLEKNVRANALPNVTIITMPVTTRTERSTVLSI